MLNAFANGCLCTHPADTQRHIHIVLYFDTVQYSPNCCPLTANHCSTFNHWSLSWSVCSVMVGRCVLCVNPSSLLKTTVCCSLKWGWRALQLNQNSTFAYVKPEQDDQTLCITEGNYIRLISLCGIVTTLHLVTWAIVDIKKNKCSFEPLKLLGAVKANYQSARSLESQTCLPPCRRSSPYNVFVTVVTLTLKTWQQQH